MQKKWFISQNVRKFFAFIELLTTVQLQRFLEIAFVLCAESQQLILCYFSQLTLHFHKTTWRIICITSSFKPITVVVLRSQFADFHSIPSFAFFMFIVLWLAAMQFKVNKYQENQKWAPKCRRGESRNTKNLHSTCSTWLKRSRMIK